MDNKGILAILYLLIITFVIVFIILASPSLMWFIHLITSHFNVNVSWFIDVTLVMMIIASIFSGMNITEIEREKYEEFNDYYCDYDCEDCDDVDCPFHPDHDEEFEDEDYYDLEDYY